MGVGANIVLAACILFAVTAVTPAADATHCTTRISAFGRSFLAPVPAPPYSSDTSRATCLRALDDGTTQTLAPQTDQVIVRIDGDFGPSIKTVRVELRGLGFAGQSFLLNRTESEFGGYLYTMAGWVFVPDPDARDGLEVTAFYPDGPQSTSWTSSPVFVDLPSVSIA